MRRPLTLRWKILAVLVLPTAIIAGLSAAVVVPAVQGARAADYVVGIVPVGAALDTYGSALVVELEASLGALGDGSGPDTEAVRAARATTDQSRAAFVAEIEGQLDSGVPVEGDRQALGSVVVGTEALGPLRARVDSGRVNGAYVLDGYTQLLRTASPVVQTLSARTDDPGLTSLLTAYSSGVVSSLYMRVERDAIAFALSTGGTGGIVPERLGALQADQDQQLQRLLAESPEGTRALLSDRLDGVDIQPLREARQVFTQLLSGQAPTARADWQATADARIDAVRAVTTPLTGLADASAVELRGDRQQRALVLAVLAALVVGLALAQGLALANRVIGPVRALTRRAEDIARELPDMLERIQTPGAAPGLAMSPLVTTSRDEIGVLAQAFNVVNDTTLRIAQEQAALRGAIASMFVNVARRNQALLGRQLTTLERLEAQEQDPDRLEELFHVDHLTTRMQRNAESLLVLAGIDTTRRSRYPMPLSDVVRTAVSEIEQYSRVDLVTSVDPQLSGRHVLVVAHLLAELLENATRFSDPATRVEVSARREQGAVVVTVVDHGLGMSQEDLAAARHKLDLPPASESAYSDRLGFFVVGRLARKLGATVTLRSGGDVRASADGNPAGTVVEISLPDALLAMSGAPADVSSLVPDSRPPEWELPSQVEALGAQPVPTSAPTPVPAAVPAPIPVPAPVPVPSAVAVPVPVALAVPAAEPVRAPVTPVPVPAAIAVPAPAAAAAPARLDAPWAPPAELPTRRAAPDGPPAQTMPAVAQPRPAAVPVDRLGDDPSPPPTGYQPVFAAAPAGPTALASRTPGATAQQQQADPLATAFGQDDGDRPSAPVSPWRRNLDILPAGGRDAKAIRTSLSAFRSSVQRARGDAPAADPTPTTHPTMTRTDDRDA